jgi:transcriptional regulator with XRE-family HTH domain
MNAPLAYREQDAAFLAQLGSRVRGWRAAHGTTRKQLAAASGISERYLAQLESGTGNISILLLRKVARAMSVPLDSLVREGARDARPIALLGLRGAGKSTLGAKLAESLDLPFVELDREVARTHSAASSGVRWNGSSRLTRKRSSRPAAASLPIPAPTSCCSSAAAASGSGPRPRSTCPA